MEYVKTDKSGNTFKTVTFASDHGDVAFVLRNQTQDPDIFFVVSPLINKSDAIKKIDDFCKEV